MNECNLCHKNFTSTKICNDCLNKILPDIASIEIENRKLKKIIKRLKKKIQFQNKTGGFNDKRKKRNKRT